MRDGFKFNTPLGWPTPPEGWEPPDGWTPDPAWPKAPAGWAFWVPEESPAEPPAQPVSAEPAPTDLPTPAQAEEDPASSQPAEPEVTAEQTSAGSDADLATVDHEIAARQSELAGLRSEIASLRDQSSRIRDENTSTRESEVKDQLVELNDALLLQQVGIYEYHHPLENAEMYKDRLRDLQDRIKDSVRQGQAILASTMFSYNNSLAKGRRMTSDFSKLTLRAYNAEADNCVRSLRAGAVATAKKRLEASAESIARLGSMMEMRVSPEYHSLRFEEIELTADYLFKVQEEREHAREERESLREQKKAEQELAAERERLDKEKSHYLNALQALQSQGKSDETADLEARIAEINAAIEANDSRRANIRAGYVYVISNIGTFGAGVVKIGLTRRLEPMDRIRELGDASVPFPFDVHAIYFSDDAVTLESELHAAFSERRLNHVNLRREFFFANPQQVRKVLADKVGNLLEFTEDPEATQYFQSQSYWPASA
jgi:hypothetical protein